MSLIDDKIGKLLEKIRNDGIKFIRFEAPSISGQAIGMLVPVRNAEYFIRKGFPFVTCALMQTINTQMALDDFEHTGFRNIPSYVDIDSYKVISWKSDLIPTASLFMAQQSKHDKVYPTDSRTLALKQLKILKNTYGIDILSSIEHEFVLLDNKTKKAISDPGTYHLDRISKFSQFFGKIEDNLYKMGIKVDRMHSEVASGQYEITAVPEFNIKSVDNAYWIRNGMREMAEQYKDWQCTFVTHLYSEGGDDFNVVEDDSGAHFNFSLYRDGKNICYDGSKDSKLTDEASYFLGGILEHCRGITALVCPTVICYSTRFNSPWVSSEGNWGLFDRTCLIRVKPSKNNTHFEFRLPSSLANPYLILASLLCAGIDGLKNKISPPKEKEYKYKLPTTLTGALSELGKDKSFSNAFDPFFIKNYIITKELEIEEMKDFKEKKIKPIAYSRL